MTDLPSSSALVRTTNRAAAARLFITEATVKTHLLNTPETPE